MLLPWFKALLLTILIECPVAALVLKARDIGRLRLIALLVFANLATHPLVWFVFPELPFHPWVSFTLSEVFAVVAEGLFFMAALRAHPARAMAASLAANALSLGVGLLIYRFLRGVIL